MATTVDEGVARRITAQERDHYREHGWVHLKRLIDPELAADLRDRIKARMASQDKGTVNSRKNAVFFQTWVDPAATDPEIAKLGYSDELGSVAAHLVGRPVRRWNNIVLLKEPHPQPFSAGTPWHQDLPALPHDRVGRPNIWIALNDIPPERASLRFLSGSHRLGPIGRFSSSDALDYYPELADQFPVAELHLEPGDATVHESPTLHGSQANTTDETRYVYCATFVRSDACYTGTQSNVADGLGLPVWKPFEHPNFPLVNTLPASWE